MNRLGNFSFRLTIDERQMITALANRLERNASDAVRLLLREKAHALGLVPAAPKDDRHEAQAI
jgi:hypothetical protein